MTELSPEALNLLVRAHKYAERGYCVASSRGVMDIGVTELVYAGLAYTVVDHHAYPGYTFLIPCDGYAEHPDFICALWRSIGQ